MSFYKTISLNLNYTIKIKWTYWHLKLNQVWGLNDVEHNSYLYLKLIQHIINKNETMSNYLKENHLNIQILKNDQNINHQYNFKYLNLYLDLIEDYLNIHDYQIFNQEIKNQSSLSNLKTIQILNHMYYTYQQTQF